MLLYPSRRDFLTRSALLPLTAALSAAPPKEPQSYEQRYPDMLAAYLAGGLNRLATQWDGKRAAISTPEALEERNAFVRRKLVEMIGGFPPRNPLQARVVKAMERPGYRVENVMFQSRPNFWVTGNLYIPTTRSGPMPAIISPCGHYPLARMLPQYQLAYQNLVHNGFVVLAFDPIGQGERRQYWNPETNVTGVGSATYEHSMPGQLLFLFGETLTGYRVWDAMRAIDYLVTRPDVDSKRIGCTGHSGGGTLTLFTSAVDERIACAVIHEGGTRNRWPVRLSPFSPLGPSDVEQNLFPAAVHGIDNADVHIAIAPRPLMATIERYSPEFDHAAALVRERYRLLGVENKFATVAADDPHAWTYRLRLATADWFSRWFHHRPGPTTEPELRPERPEDLRCLPNGSIRYSRHGETIWTILRNKPQAMEDPRKSMRQLLHYRELNGPLNPLRVAEVPREGYTIEKLAFLSEPGIYIPTWVFQPKQRKPGSPTILYFNEAGKDSDGMEFAGSEASGLRPGVLASFARNGYQVIAADVRGIGETRPPHRPSSSVGEFHHLFDTETALTYMGWFQGSSLLGMRVQDVIRTVDYAQSRADKGSSLWMIGKDMGALWTLYAAALDARIESVVCHRGLLSYRLLTAGDRYLHGADIIVPHVLEHFDLPQVVELIAPRRVVLLSPVDAMKRPVAGAIAEDADGDLAAQYLHLLSGGQG